MRRLVQGRQISRNGFMVALPNSNGHLALIAEDLSSGHSILNRVNRFFLFLSCGYLSIDSVCTSEEGHVNVKLCGTHIGGDAVDLSTHT